MMLKQIAMLLATFVVLCAVFVFVERTFSQTFQQCVANHDENKNSAVKANPSIFGMTIDRYARCSDTFLKTYASAITALATIVIVAFTGVLWVAVSRQAVTREALLAGKRAFVFATGIRAFYESDPATAHFNWRLCPAWQNSGETPTRQLQFYTDCLLSNARLPPTFDFNFVSPNSPLGSGMLGPKMTELGGQAPHSPIPPITPQDILDIQNGHRFLYLWGWAQYFDTLPNAPRHITRFCWQILVTGDPFTFNPAFNPNSVQFFNVHEARGNCADEECMLQGLGTPRLVA